MFIKLLQILKMNALYDLNAVLGFLLFAQLTESFNVFVIDKLGHVNELSKPIHLDAELTPKNIRARLERQLEDFLRKTKEIHHNTKVKNVINKKSTYTGFNDFRNSSSPVVYSNGRYTLDLDKLDIKEDILNSQSGKEGYYFDPAESFRDYYDYINVRQLLRKPNSKDALKKSSERDDSLRKNNKLLIGNKKITSRYPVFRTKNKEKKGKRFKVVNNDKNKNKHKKKKEYSIKYISDENLSASNKEYFEELSEENLKKSSDEEAVESDGDFYYLQANELVKLKPKASSRKTDDWSDSRRRLPHFLPKRFHWHPDEMRHLGYFWFNGPRGKYPEATPLH